LLAIGLPPSRPPPYAYIAKSIFIHLISFSPDCYGSHCDSS
jgi:hypothetical protein